MSAISGGMALARLTRHEILKEDKFMVTLEEIRDFFLAKKAQILMGLGIGAFIALTIFGFYYYSAHQNEKAKDQLSQALKTYEAPLAAANQPQNAGSSDELLFKTSSEKYERALAEFQKIIRDYPSRPSGKIARYYAGLCLDSMKRKTEAVAMLEPLSKEKSDYGALARSALAAVYENSGDLAKSAEIYQQIINSSSPVTPKNVSLMHLARLYEEQNKTTEAAKTYQQVVKEFPESSFVTEAEQKLKQIAR
jgi:tetratricopeptide (TPR) repeat protein